MTDEQVRGDLAVTQSGHQVGEDIVLTAGQAEPPRGLLLDIVQSRLQRIGQEVIDNVIGIQSALIEGFREGKLLDRASRHDRCLVNTLLKLQRYRDAAAGAHALDRAELGGCGYGRAFQGVGQRKANQDPRDWPARRGAPRMAQRFMQQVPRLG